MQPVEAGLDPDALEDAFEYAAANRSDGFLVVRHGALVREAYWGGKSEASLQQTFSGTKSLFSLLVGRLIDNGVLSGLDQSVAELVPEVPTSLAQMTFRNVMAMQSGVANSPDIERLGQAGQSQLEIALEREVEAEPFERYHYNNAPYRLLFTALERASGRTLEELTHTEVFEPLNFDGAYWVRLYAVDEGGERFSGYQSIRMRPRDFAKSAQIIVSGGEWCGQRYLPEAYIKALVSAPAPEVNPSFGLFHHLNGAFYRDFDVPNRIDRQPMPGAPNDAFLMFGAGGQVTIGVPSLALVIVRTGTGVSIYEPDNPVARLIKMIVDAVVD
jgi:CubicO group peptidase (beta-lactamase class C family)